MARSDVLNIPEGVVALTYPDSFSEESYCDIEAWLTFEIAKLKRWASNSTEDGLPEEAAQSPTPTLKREGQP